MFITTSNLLSPNPCHLAPFIMQYSFYLSFFIFPHSTLPPQHLSQHSSQYNTQYFPLLQLPALHGIALILFIMNPLSRSLFVTFLFALFFAIFSTPSLASYFYVLDTEPTCFIEDVPEDTAIVIKYANLDLEQIGLGLSNVQQVVRVSVTDPNSRDVVQHDCLKKGQVAFTSRIAGDYKICLDLINSPRHGRQYKFGLTVVSAAESKDYSQIAKSEHFSAIVVEMTKLNDRVLSQTNELGYIRDLEANTRNETENVHDRIVLFFALQAIIIIGAMLIQIFKLRHFFKGKQLVN